MPRIAFLLRKGGDEWETRVEEVPESAIKTADTHESARQWGRKNLLKRPEYEGVTYLGIHSMSPKAKGG